MPTTPAEIQDANKLYTALNEAALEAYTSAREEQGIAPLEFEDGTELKDKLEAISKAYKNWDETAQAAYKTKLEEKRKAVLGLDGKERTAFNALIGRLTGLHRVGTSSALVQQEGGGELRFHMLERLAPNGTRDGIGNPGGIAEKTPEKVGDQDFDNWFKELETTSTEAASILVSMMSGDDEQKETREKLNAAMIAANKGDGKFLENLQGELKKQGFKEEAAAQIVAGVTQIIEELLPEMKSLRGKISETNGKLTAEALEMLEGGLDDLVFDGAEIRRLDLSDPDDMALFAANDNGRETTEELGAIGKKIASETEFTLLKIPFADVEWLISGKLDVLGGLFLTSDDAITTPKVGLREITAGMAAELKQFQRTSEVQKVIEISSAEALARWTVDHSQNKETGYRYAHEPWSVLLAEVKYNGVEGLAELAKNAQIEIQKQWQEMGKLMEDCPVFSLETLLAQRGQTTQDLANAIHNTLAEVDGYELNVDSIKTSFEGMDAAAQKVQEAYKTAYEAFKEAAKEHTSKGFSGGRAAFDSAQESLETSWKAAQDEGTLPQDMQCPTFKLSMTQWSEIGSIELDGGRKLADKVPQEGEKPDLDPFNDFKTCVDGCSKTTAIAKAQTFKTIEQSHEDPTQGANTTQKGSTGHRNGWTI